MTDDELRDDFGDELSQALSIRSRADAPADTAVAVRRRARRVRTRRALTATLVAALAVTGISVIATSRQGPRHIRVAAPPSSSTSTTTTTVPSSFKPLTTGVDDWTWVSNDHGWALVRKPCGTTVCVALRETTDGGHTWSSLPAPDALDARAQVDRYVACAARPCVSGVRFATSKIGWLFGPALYETRDGGHTWTRTPGAPVLAVEAANGLAMRVTTTDRSYRDCTYRCTNYVYRKRLESSSWQRLPGYAAPTLLLQENDVYDVSPPNFAGAGLASIRLSTDRGTTWTTIDDPCDDDPAYGSRTASATAAPDGVLAVLCISTEPSAASVQISTDRGKTFGPRRGVPRRPTDTFGPIAAASVETIAIAYSDPKEYGVLVTHDGGKSWQPTLVPSAAPTRATTFAPSLGWEDAHTGRASFNTNVIWTTRDGGRSWTEDRVAP